MKKMIDRFTLPTNTDWLVTKDEVEKMFILTLQEVLETDVFAALGAGTAEAEISEGVLGADREVGLSPPPPNQPNPMN
jgi:hypothetical protein